MFVFYLPSAAESLKYLDRYLSEVAREVRLLSLLHYGSMCALGKHKYQAAGIHDCSYGHACVYSHIPEKRW